MRGQRAYVSAALSFAMFATMGVAAASTGVSPAEAVPSYSQYQQAIETNNQLKQQLSGVSTDLQNEILKLNDLTSNQIPAAQTAANAAQDAAQQAKDQASAAQDRLDAAKADKADLEKKIAQTGENYDDAKEAVAQLARNSFHGSNTSQVMDVVTNSKTTEQFVNSMQANVAVTRTENQAADSAATTLSASMNRKQRLESIEQEIATLKTQADQQSATAQQAASDAQAKQASLQQLRDEGNTQRASLESKKGELTTAAAKQAADIVSIKSQIDSYNQQIAAAAAKASASSGGQQQVSSRGSSSSSSSSGSSRSSGSSSSSKSSSGSSSNRGSAASSGASGMSYSVPGSCGSTATYCYGHNTGRTSVGSGAYPSRQCTLWAYLRRTQLGLPVGSYMGNGGSWAATARGLGYLVNNTPHVGAVMVVAPGQRVTTWSANAAYGHVAIVERVNSDGTILISEGGTGFSSFPTTEIVSSPSRFQYIQY